MVRWSWVNCQCRGVLLLWKIVGQGPNALAVGAGGGCLDILLSSIFSLSPCLWETARYRLKYCLKGPLNPKQPTNHVYDIWVQLFKASSLAYSLSLSVLTKVSMVIFLLKICEKVLHFFRQKKIAFFFVFFYLYYLCSR